MKITMSKKEATKKLEEYLGRELRTTLGDVIEVEIVEDTDFREKIVEYYDEKESQVLKNLNVFNPVLESFLKSNGLLKQFAKNYVDCRKSVVDDICHYDLTAAFSWAETPEGHEFWSDINRKFHEMMISDIN